MSMSDHTGQPVRACALRIIEAMDRFASEPNKFSQSVVTALRDLSDVDDLADMGVPRQGNNVANSQYLYFDGDLSIILFEVPADTAVPPHDHGVWEAFCVYRGAVQHKVYTRADDQTVAGYAELEVLEDRKMQPGDVAIVAPPADIHGFCADEPGTLGITVMAGAYKPDRHYYQPEANSYVIKTPVNAR